jgi:putative transposase
LPRRWVVERTFAWLSHNRRMSKDCEKLLGTSEALIYVAMTRLMVRRLARREDFQATCIRSGASSAPP